MYQNTQKMFPFLKIGLDFYSLPSNIFRLKKPKKNEKRSDVINFYEQFLTWNKTNKTRFT